MPSLFSRSHHPPKKDRTPAVLVTNGSGTERRILGLAKTWNGASASQSSPTVGEFGTVPQHLATTAHGTHSGSSRGQQDHSDSTTLLPGAFVFLPTQVPIGAHSTLQAVPGEDTIRQYGFLGGLGRTIVLGVDEVARVIRDVGAELGRRALDTPMLFSNQSLEISQTRLRMIVQSYVGTLKPSGSRSPSQQASNKFAQDVQFASDHELAWLLRWALSRLTRVREGTREVCHGCLDWDMYEEWRGRERAAKYPFDAFSAFSSILPRDVFHYVVRPLFDLLSRFAAHSHKSGLTPHAISSFFAPLLFDVPANVPCLNAHAAFVRAASATEHMLLSYIRSSGSSDNLGLSDLPFRLQEWVKGYPAMVASDADLARGLPRRAARVVRCEVATRTVRAYARDLIQDAESWADDIHSGWSTWERVLDRTRRGEASRPKFSTAWRRRLVVKETLPLPLSRNQKQQIAYGAPLQASQNGGNKGEPDEGDEGKYSSLAGKEWSMFEEGGFDAPRDSFGSRNDNNARGDIQSRLQFDLNEGAKKSVAERRQTMDWSDFAAPSGGFSRTEPFLTASLTFSAPVQSQITEWPKERDELRRRLQKTQKESTPFNHNTTPRTGASASLDGADSKGRVYIEEAFVDCWADFMLGSGWTDRDELTFKEASWALIEYKARPNHPEAHDSDGSLDPRTSELYFLFEERVPMDYQMAVADPKRKKTLNKFFSKKKNRQQDFDPRVMHQTDFDKMLERATQPRKLTITRADQSVSSSLWHAVTDSMKVPPTAGMPATPMASSRTLKAAPPKLSPSAIGTPRAPSASPGNASRSPDDHAKMSNGRPGIFKKSIRRVKSGEQQLETARQQREVSMDFEIQTASGQSSGNNSPQNSKEEKWMDILIANGAKPMDVNPKTERRITPPDVVALPKTKQTRRVSPPVAEAAPIATRPSGGEAKPALRPALHIDSAVHDRGDSDVVRGDHSAAVKTVVSAPSPERGGAESQPSSVHTIEDGSVQPSDSISMRRRPVDASPPESPIAPIVPAKSDTEILTSPRSSAALSGAYDGIVAPKPRVAGDRGAIISIVDSFRDSRHTDHTQFSELSDDAAYSGIERNSYASEQGSQMGDNRESVIERTYASERINSAYSLEDDFAPPPIFDLTPGREPSPARYKHGEPLQFVGEEEEDEY